MLKREGIGWSTDLFSGGLYCTRGDSWNRKCGRCGRRNRNRRTGCSFLDVDIRNLGMRTKFSEVTLAVHFRETNANGELVGGPDVLHQKRFEKTLALACVPVFAFGVLTVFEPECNAGQHEITTAIDRRLYNFNLLMRNPHRP